jgi:hypothetical protein
VHGGGGGGGGGGVDFVFHGRPCIVSRESLEPANYMDEKCRHTIEQRKGVL